MVKVTRTRKNERGQSLVELALTAPFIFLVFAGLIHFGMMMHAQQSITNASRVAARRAQQQNPSEGAVYKAVMDYCERAGLDTGKVSTSIEMGSVGTDTQVTVTYQFDSPVAGLFRAMTALVSDQSATMSNQLQATTVMRY